MNPLIKTANKEIGLGVAVKQVFTHKSQVFVKQEIVESPESYIVSWSPIHFYWKSN